MLENVQMKETLPKGPEDERIPSTIHQLDIRADFIHDQLTLLQRELEELDVERCRLLNRAREVRVVEDDFYKIVEEPVYPKKHVDVEALKRLAPEKYEMIKANLESVAKDKLKAQMEKIQVSIAQSDVKAVIRDKVLLMQIIPEPKEPSGWRSVIVKKQG